MKHASAHPMAGRRDGPQALQQLGRARDPGRQHSEFVNIPSNFGQPTADDCEQVADTLDRWKDTRVLVHWEVAS